MSGEDNRTITETDIQTAVDITSSKKNVIMDSQILTSLMNCARLADFRFNMNLQSIKGKSNSIECGSIVHKFLEVYYGTQIKGVDRVKALGFGMAAAELYIQGCPSCTGFIPTPEIPKPLCGHKPDDYPGVKNTPPDSEGYKTGWKFALQTCEDYASYYKNDHWVSLEVETVKQRVIYEDDDMRVMWKAKLDWVVDTNQGIFPADHKTMKQRRDTSSLNNQFKGQCVIMDTRKVFINKIGFQKTLPLNERFDRDVIPYSADILVEWVSETVPWYARMLLMYAETGYFPPNYSNCEGKYGPCAFQEVCKSNPNMREHELKQGFIVGPVWNPTNEEE